MDIETRAAQYIVSVDTRGDLRIAVRGGIFLAPAGSYRLQFVCGGLGLVLIESVAGAFDFAGIHSLYIYADGEIFVNQPRNSPQEVQLSDHLSTAAWKAI